MKLAQQVLEPCGAVEATQHGIDLGPCKTAVVLLTGPLQPLQR